jgi:cell division protein FtsI/penicillin-binding protein 2
MFERRMLVVGIVLVAAMGTMATRLFSLTVVSGSEQRALAQSRLDRSSLLPTVRGAITDRKGRVLAESVPSYDLAVFYPAINGTWASTRAIAAAKLHEVRVDGSKKASASTRRESRPQPPPPRSTIARMSSATEKRDSHSAALIPDTDSTSAPAAKEVMAPAAR